MAVEGGQGKGPQDVKPARDAKPASAKGKAPASDAGAAGRAPAWLVPAYLGGLALLYLSERVVVTQDKLRVAFSLVGVALVVVATGLRFAPQYRGRGDRASIQRLLGYLSLVGLAGIAVYFATTSWGQGLLGIADLEAKTRENVGSLLLITWVTLIAASVIPMSFAGADLHPMRNSSHRGAGGMTRGHDLGGRPQRSPRTLPSCLALEPVLWRRSASVARCGVAPLRKKSIGFQEPSRHRLSLTACRVIAGNCERPVHPTRRRVVLG